MTLHDVIQADASGVFANEDEFGEAVTYHPHRFAGDAERANRSIIAVVVRNDVNDFEVTVVNDSTLGISSDELDVGKDQLDIPERDGKNDANPRTIVRILSQDEGMIELQVQ